MSVDGLRAGLERMRRAGSAEHAIATFERYYPRLLAGDRGLLPECDIEPLERLPDLDDDPAADGALERVAIVRLNGGLATSMAARAAKGLLDVKGGLSFVDLAVRQAAILRRQTSCALPLLFMNSAATGPATMASLSEQGDQAGRGPGEFWQSVLPRLRADDLQPIDWPRDAALEWAPAGHGDVFPALAESGQLRALREAGFDHVCISSIDNVAAIVDGRIASLMQREEIPFLMEVADRTASDRKGGHLARRHAGGLVLRELAQVPSDDLGAFQDIDRHRYFNTNTIWVDLRALEALLTKDEGVLGLPLIANRKVVDPYDESSPEVIQIETAMGAAISVFPGAAARRVDRRGFNPVKTTAELLAVRSDAYVLTDGARVELAGERGGRAPVIELDAEFFGRQRDFDERFPEGPPSLIGCDRLVVRGDVIFGRDVVVRGSACIEHRTAGQLEITSGSVLGDG